MARPEGGQQGLVRANDGVVVEPHHFRVARLSGANVFVARLVEVALRVAHFRLDDSGDALEGQLHAPEAARAELSQLEPWLVGRVQIRRHRRTTHSQCKWFVSEDWKARFIGEKMLEFDILKNEGSK